MFTARLLMLSTSSGCLGLPPAVMKATLHPDSPSSCGFSGHSGNVMFKSLVYHNERKCSEAVFSNMHTTDSQTFGLHGMFPVSKCGVLHCFFLFICSGFDLGFFLVCQVFSPLTFPVMFSTEMLCSALIGFNCVLLIFPSSGI